MVLCYGSPSKVIQKKERKGGTEGERKRRKRGRGRKWGRRKEWEEGRVEKGKEGRKKLV